MSNPTPSELAMVIAQKAAVEYEVWRRNDPSVNRVNVDILHDGVRFAAAAIEPHIAALVAENKRLRAVAVAAKELYKNRQYSVDCSCCHNMGEYWLNLRDGLIEARAYDDCQSENARLDALQASDD